MHSRVFNVSINDDFNYFLDETEVFEKLNGVCDYVSDEVDLHSDIEDFILFDTADRDKIVKVYNEDYDIEGFKVPYDIIKKFVNEFKQRKANTLKKMLANEIPILLNYYEGKSSAKECEASLNLYKAKRAICDIFDYYIIFDGSVKTLDDAVIDIFETIKEGEYIYFYQSFVYHY